MVNDDMTDITITITVTNNTTDAVIYTRSTPFPDVAEQVLQDAITVMEQEEE